MINTARRYAKREWNITRWLVTPGCNAKRRRSEVQAVTCPVCNCDTRIIDSRKNSDYVVRYRKCRGCGYRFPTVEIDEDIYRRRKTEPASDADVKLKQIKAALKEIAAELEKK
jgi:C4-type Zn-finger protein